MSPKFWTEARIADAKTVLTQHTTLSAAASALGVSLPALEHGFARYAGGPPGQFLGRPTTPAAPRVDRPVNGHTVIISDLHAPFHDARAWDVCIAAITELAPDTIVIIGDAADFYAVSKFDKSPERASRLVDELAVFEKEMRRLRRASPNSRVVYCQGNHEFRLDRYITSSAPALHGLVVPRELILRALPGAEWVKYRSAKRIGKVDYAHDLGFSGVYAGKHTLAANGANIVFGHTHRGGVVVEGDVQGDRRFSLNVGWLGDIAQIDYTYEVIARNWTLGFGHIFTDEETGLVWPSFVPVMRDRCYVAGRTVRL